MLRESARCDLRSLWPSLDGSIVPMGVRQVEQWRMSSVNYVPVSVVTIEIELER